MRQMSTKRLAIRGVAFNWLGQACTFAVIFVVTPILIHGLGNEAYGLWSLLMAQATYYALVDVGLRPAVTKYVAEYQALDDRPAINRVAVTGLVIFVVLALVVLLAAAALAVVFPFIFPVGRFDPNILRWVVFLVGMSVAVTLVENVFDGLLAAAKRFDLLNVIVTGTHIVRSIFMVVVISMEGQLLAMSVVFLAFSLIRLVLAFLFARRTFDYLSPSISHFDWTTARTLFRFGILNAAHGVTLKITKSAGAIITGMVLGLAMVTFFTIADTLVKKTLELGKGLTRVVMPVASQLNAQDRKKDLIRLLTLSVRVTLAMSLALTGTLIALGHPLIRFWIGEEYARNSYPVLCVLACAMVFTPMANTSRNILKGINQLGIVVKVGLLDVVLTLGLGWLGAQSFGMIGMAWAVLLSQAVTSGFLMPVVACRRMQLPLGQYVSRGVVPGLAAALPAIGAAATVGLLLPPANLVQVVAYGLIIAAVSGLSIFAICFERELKMDVIRSIVPFLKTTP